MPKIDFSKFRPVHFEFGKVHFKGGLLTKPMPMTTRVVRMQSGSDETFVNLKCKEPWLVEAATGNKRYNGSSFGRTSLVDILHNLTKQFCDGDLQAEGGSPTDADAAVAAVGDDYDPMAEVDGSPSVKKKGLTASRGCRRLRYYKTNNKGKVVTVPLPARCAEEDAHCQDVRDVTLFIADRKSVWVSLRDLAWVVQILFVQNQLKGVPLIPADSAGPGGAPCGA